MSESGQEDPETGCLAEKAGQGKQLESDQTVEDAIA
jgi:hypothetical protein